MKMIPLKVETGIRTVFSPLLSPHLHLHSETLGQVESRHWERRVSNRILTAVCLCMQGGVHQPIGYSVQAGISQGHRDCLPALSQAWLAPLAT